MATSIVCLTSTYDPLSVSPLANAAQQQEAAHGGVSPLAQTTPTAPPASSAPAAPPAPSAGSIFGALAVQAAITRE